LAVAALGELGWSAERAATVERMILGTVDHRVEGVALDEAVLFAADLGILAADPARYSDYVRAVRREYAHVAEPDWIVGRAAVLRSFIDRDAIYAAVLELDAWEQRARGNLRSELESLRA
jgi:predicted metal-dependent HD superfamily phosphohydrolase